MLWKLSLITSAYSIKNLFIKKYIYNILQSIISWMNIEVIPCNITKEKKNFSK